MVLERTVSPYDVGDVVVNTFGDRRISLVVINNTIVITPASADGEASHLAALSENALAKDWLLPEEDEAWDETDADMRKRMESFRYLDGLLAGHDVDLDSLKAERLARQ